MPILMSVQYGECEELAAMRESPHQVSLATAALHVIRKRCDIEFSAYAIVFA
jgi:hypothetical protein